MNLVGFGYATSCDVTRFTDQNTCVTITCLQCHSNYHEGKFSFAVIK